MMAGTRFADLQAMDQLLMDMVVLSTVPETAISGLAIDSRQVEANYAFLACAGSDSHGMNFADEAVHRGAVVIVAEPDGEWSAERLEQVAESVGVPLVILPDLGRHASAIAGRFYHYPAEEMRLVGVTGTNGKTSVCHFLAQVLPEEWRCATIGTMGYGFPEDLRPGNHTTPDPVLMQAELGRLSFAGARAVAVEVSSHALDQYRVAAVPFHTAVFTNLSRDHLDYHGTLTAYGDAKRRLFSQPGLQQAIFNVDDALGLKLAEEVSGKLPVIACSRKRAAIEIGERFVQVSRYEIEPSGIHLELHTSWGDGQLFVPLLGEFNIDNLLLVLAVMLGWDLPLDQCLTRLAKLRTIDGRMQRLGRDDEPAVVVDFAHTPDALEQALKALHAHTTGKLTCIFGCGGDRDTGKRPLMGAVAEALADRVIVTDDNPRHEGAAGITQDILQGMSDPVRIQVIHNRAEAIRTAINDAVMGDVILVAGKGHERFQQVGDLALPFNDAEQVKLALAGWQR